MKIREFLRVTLNLNNDVDIAAANDNIRKSIPFQGPNVYILFAAVIIASVGLNVNSIPVIIGAMLISPLMGPILGFGLGLGTNDRQLLLASLRNLFVMVGISLLASTLYFILTPLEIDNPTELLARTRPTIYDVLIALFGGLAGVLEIARKEKGTVMSGVAIATALMPPLCTVGYGIANLSIQYTMGALFLFTINCIFIAMAAYIMAKFLKFPMVENEKNKPGYRILSYALVLILVATSIFTGYNVIRENNFTKSANRFVKKNHSIGKTYIYDSSVNINHDPYILDLRMAGESLTDETREMLLREAESFGIMRSQIVIHEDATVHFEEFNETQIVRDLISSNEANIQMRDDSIRALRAQLRHYRNAQLPAEQLAAELRMQLPTVTSLTLAKGAHFDEVSTMTDNQVVVLLYSQMPLNEEEQTRVQQWLTVRLNTTNVVLINEVERSQSEL